MNSTAANDEPGCSIAASLDIVGDRWTILILRDSFRGLHRFDEFRRDLDIPRAVLADRLRRLVDAGVLVKRQYSEHPPRDEYRLTDMGRELSPILVALMQWGDRWLGGPDGPDDVIPFLENVLRGRNVPCGTEVDLRFHCWECDEDFSPLEIASRR